MSLQVVEEPQDDRSPQRFERTPPQNLEAEMSALGGMLLSKDAIGEVAEILRETDFYKPAHQIVYGAIIDLYGKGEPADPVTVSAELTRTGEIARMGGAPYLHTLVNFVPTAANANYYAQIVADVAIQRRLIEAGTRIVQIGYGATEDVETAVDRAEQEVFDVRSNRSSDDYVALGDLVQSAYDELESIGSNGGGVAGIPTGFSRIDEITNGLHPGQLIVVAARPAVGKSTFGLDLARACSIKHGQTSVIFSLEMSRIEITMRLLSAEARVHLSKMRNGQMGEDEWLKLARRMGDIASAPLYIDDSPNLTMMEIRSKARRLRERNNLKLIVIDYLQLMSSPRKVENRQQEVSEISRACKLLAKELEVPVIAMSQLNRGSEQRADKRPQLSDMRESGAIEQDADMVILLHREELYEKETARAGEADAIIAKHRNGPTDTVILSSQLHYSRFADMAPNH